MGVLLQAFYFQDTNPNGVPSPLDGDPRVPFWWDHFASQANDFRRAGFTALWLPGPLKGGSGGFSNGYDVFDDYDLGSKDQKGIVPTRYGSREQLERCAAILRANGLDIYLDIVNHQRDGDIEPFVFRYKDAFGTEAKGRFPKNPGDFHPNVPDDPHTFDTSLAFGRSLAPINGVGHHAFNGLLDAGDWLTKAVDAQGFRIDDAKGISTDYLLPFLNHGAMAGKFAVGEFFDTNSQLIQTWKGLMQYRISAFDFALHFTLRQMCDFPDFFFMGDLDHAGYAGVDPLGAVTFVENHDTDQNSKGEAIIANKALAYAYILTSEGYPCVFYKDYSTDAGCYGLKNIIDPLIWIHENLAAGPTLQRFKDFGVFAYERLGDPKLLVVLNKDAHNPRTITVATSFGANVQLHEFTGQGQTFDTDGSATRPSPFRRTKMAGDTSATHVRARRRPSPSQRWRPSRNTQVRQTSIFVLRKLPTR
jgi:alpha-amylase